MSFFLVFLPLRLFLFLSLLYRHTLLLFSFFPPWGGYTDSPIADVHIPITPERHNVTLRLLIPVTKTRWSESARSLVRVRERALTKVNKTRLLIAIARRAAIKRRHASRSFTKAIQDTGATRV